MYKSLLSGDYIENVNSYRKVHEGYEDTSTDTSNLIPEFSLHEEISIESPTQTSIRGTQINKETNYDVLCNLIHFIGRQQHSNDAQRHNRMQIFDNNCTSRSFNPILSSVVWHKLNDRTDGGIDGRSFKRI